MTKEIYQDFYDETIRLRDEYVKIYKKESTKDAQTRYYTGRPESPAQIRVKEIVDITAQRVLKHRELHDLMWPYGRYLVDKEWMTQQGGLWLVDSYLIVCDALLRVLKSKIED